MAKRLKRPEPKPADPYQAQPLPVDSPVAVYYRQSSEAQVGNISTTLQTVDMVEHLEKLGWLRERVIMVDMDAGISGTKKIEDRPGMSYVYSLIERQAVRAVAAQDVDRFFRDVTQIETNVFIDACKRNNVLVLTPSFVYDFAHPVQGRYHMQLFREQAQRAADFLEYQIHGRLVKSRTWLKERGYWSGRDVLYGFKVDRRRLLPTGEANPGFRKYTRYDPFADVMLAYFELFRHFEGNLTKTWKHIQEHGPFFADIPPDVPLGFKVSSHITHRSLITGQLCPTPNGLESMLSNVGYIGHWVHKSVIVQWNNHEAIIPMDLFMYTFNRLSAVDFFGDPNPHYVPQRPQSRSPRKLTEYEKPTYAGILYSDDVPEHPHKRLTYGHAGNQAYSYRLLHPYETIFWSIRCDVVDPAIDGMLLERLKATTIDEEAWQAAVASFEQHDRSEVRRLQSAIRHARQTQDSIMATLGLLTNKEMVQRAEAQYETAGREIEMLTAELEQAQNAKQQTGIITQARPAMEKLIANWDRIPRPERRYLFEQFADHVHITKPSRSRRIITVLWRDGSQSAKGVVAGDYYWPKEDIELLRQMIEGNADQIDILRAFPTSTWYVLMCRYADRFNNRRWPETYTGKKIYPVETRWTDTEEYKQEEDLRPSVSSTPIHSGVQPCS